MLGETDMPATIAAKAVALTARRETLKVAGDRLAPGPTLNGPGERGRE